MESQPTPRITAPYLDSYQGRNVMVIGRVVQLRGDQAIVDADGTITAHLNRDAHLSNGSAVQVIGKVNPDLSIRVLSSLDLGTGVDFDVCQKGSVSLIWPSDSVSQHRIVASSQTHDGGQQQQDNVSGDGLAGEMVRLGISDMGKGPSSKASSSIKSPEPPTTEVQRQERQQQLPRPDEMLIKLEDRSYESLGSMARAPAGDPEANAAAVSSHRTSTIRSERMSKTPWHRGDINNTTVSPELAKSIFGGISRTIRGKRFALLTMDDSGRWRVARSQLPAKTFPGNEM
ncbi:hypothetical protein VPNG_05557 [Cytospora leucostoma]|uniref:Uncharacterized protein n=1 Tax=Cytospora leucostoma TaxID=1230097 RepID=A0A423X6V1_9PEZI|nr:hypothetical protein VPNG_05557 [Cytospora leucostoma]